MVKSMTTSTQIKSIMLYIYVLLIEREGTMAILAEFCYIFGVKGEILSFIKSCDLFFLIQPDAVRWLGNDRDLFQI